MVSAVDQQRVCALLTEAMTVICKNGLTYNNKFCIEGLLGITMDDTKMFLVNIRETVFKARPEGAKQQNRSDSMSKTGMLVGGRPVVQTQQGMRSGPPIGVGRPGMGMNQGAMQMMAQRRRGGPQMQNVIPAKRPMLGPGQAPPGGMKVGGDGTTKSMPQEWAALIQLQQAQKPPGPTTSQPAPYLHRGRGRPPTARRGGLYRGGVHQRDPGQVGDGPVRSPTRRNSQGGIDVEAREEHERKAAEQAKSRSERLQRRQAGFLGDKSDISPSKDGSDSSETGSKEKKTTTESDTTTEPKPQTPDCDVEKNTRQDDEKETDTPKETVSGGETVSGKTENKPNTDAKTDNGETTKDTSTTSAPTTKDGGEHEDQEQTKEEQTKEETKEGDGSWLLSNSNWLLGDIEAPPHEDDEKVAKTDTG